MEVAKVIDRRSWGWTTCETGYELLGLRWAAIVEVFDHAFAGNCQCRYRRVSMPRVGGLLLIIENVQSVDYDAHVVDEEDI